MDPRSHWDRIYKSKSPAEMSWFQREATVSLDLITHEGATSDAVIDVGGGASPFVDGLLSRGYTDVTVLDIAAAALDAARTRLGNLGQQAKWVTADVLDYSFRLHTFDVWHDRAVFHFLTSATDRRAYVDQVVHAVRPGGTVVVATFAEDGPAKCSGLDVCRYSPEALHAEFGPRFMLRKTVREDHVTPDGTIQRFQYCLCTLATAHSASV